MSLEIPYIEHDKNAEINRRLDEILKEIEVIHIRLTQIEDRMVKKPPTGFGPR